MKAGEDLGYVIIEGTKLTESCSDELNEVVISDNKIALGEKGVGMGKDWTRVCYIWRL